MAKKGNKSAPGGRLSVNGQHLPTSDGCIATYRTGKPCSIPRVSKLMPYCGKCMRTGDPSLKAVKHPRFGKILIAKRNLPKGYYVAWWGNLLPKKKIARKRMEWALETTKGMVDAVPYDGSQLKYCACVGPNELPTIDFAPNSDVLLNRGEDKAAVMFRTLRPIPRNWQVDMMYNKDEKSTDEFFQEQGICRGDVGTKRYPALRKKNADPPVWLKATGMKKKATKKKVMNMKLKTSKSRSKKSG
ncbi:unnamed protein product [Symbiodinium necroappetens]|uniref:Uncharacterized protein n=1 Tax=Symbiodinium necroappetens TaxID=1628268 RepID=A0A812SK46_9DINO|nr:unnamed protein product [Symbiodinium necroappetens]